MAQNIRKCVSVALAIAIYYIVHEGAHLLVALALGTFERVNFAFFGLGMQIVARTWAMTNGQLIVFATAGPACALLAGYILVLCRARILRANSEYLRTVSYYGTLVLLWLDPLYLSILFRFVGGGDMNGILLLGVSEAAASIFFLCLLLLNIFIVIKLVYPAYKNRFLQDVF